MNINLRCAELRKNIAKLINESELPISLVYYMIKDMMSELDEVHSQVLAKEREEVAKAQNQELSE